MTEAHFWATAPGLTLPRGRAFWTTPEMVPPGLRRAVVTEVFFDRKPSWLKNVRYRHSIGDELLGPVQWNNDRPIGARLYSLHNVERLIHVLLDREAVTGTQAAHALGVVLAVGRVYGHGPAFDAIAREAADDHR